MAVEEKLPDKKDLPKKGIIKSLTEMFKSMKDTEDSAGGLGGMFSALELLAPILEPFQIILEIIGMLFSVMAAEILPPLMEALEPIFEMLIDLAPLFKEIGKLIGGMVKSILPLLVKAFMSIMKAIMPLLPVLIDLAKKILPILIEVVVHIVNVITAVLKPILNWLASLSASELAAVMYALFVGIAFFYGLLHAPPGAGVVVGLAFAGLVAAIMLPMLFAEGGIVTQPTMGIVGEAGAEAVVPLDEWRDSNQEVIWALEDNGEKLDHINRQLYFATRKRRGALR